jgi:hypothetical protein
VGMPIGGVAEEQLVLSRNHLQQSFYVRKRNQSAVDYVPESRELEGLKRHKQKGPTYRYPKGTRNDSRLLSITNCRTNDVPVVHSQLKDLLAAE